MSDNESLAAESDPLLPPANLTANAVTNALSITATAETASNRRGLPRLSTEMPCLLCFFCLVVGDVLASTAAMQIRAGLICRALFPDLPADADLGREPACKSGPVQTELAMTVGSLCAAVVGGACLTVAGSSILFVASLVVLQLGGGYEFTFRGMTSEMVDPSDIAVLFTVHSVLMMLSEVAAGPVLAAVFRQGLDLGNGWMALPFFVATILLCVTLVMTCSVRLAKYSQRPVVRTHQDPI